MAVQFTKATKKRKKARIALIGVTGGGKTLSALNIARGLVGPEGRIAVLDTEHGSASLYSDRHTFDVLEIASFAPEVYIEAVEGAAAAGFDILIIDSWSHAWAGKDGILEFIDAKKRANGNAFNAWGDATPKQNDMVETILRAPLHVIVTMRSKMEYVQEKDDKTGKVVIRKVGLQPIQRADVEFEFDIVGDLSRDNYLTITKTRYSAFAGRTFEKPTEKVGADIAAWLNDGAEPAAPTPPPTVVTINGKTHQTAGIEKDDLLSVWNLSTALEKSPAGKGSAKQVMLDTAGVDSSLLLTAATGTTVIAALKDALGKAGVDTGAAA